MIRVFKEVKDTFTNLASGTMWEAYNGTVDLTTLEATLTGNGVAQNPGIQAAQTAAVIGHKYYVRIMAKVTNSVCQQMRFQYGGVIDTFVTSPVLNSVYDVSRVITATSTSDVMYIDEYYADAATANGKVLVLYSVIIIDLTAKFTAGLEWTSERMDRIKPLWSLAETYAETFTRTICVNDFNKNGEKVIQPKSCVEVYQDNVDWRVELTADVSYVPWLKQDYILVLPTKNKGEQPFRINNVKVTKYDVSFTARHIGYDLENHICNLPFGYKWISGIAYLVSRTLGYSFPVNQYYTIMPNWAVGKYVTYKGTTLLENLYELIGVHGGHLVFDWFKVSIEETIGSDNGVEIEYGKNLIGAEVVEDWNSVCTQLMPIGDNKLLLGTATNMLTADISYDRPYTRKFTFQTADVVELETLGNAYLEANKYPKLNYKVQADTIENVEVGDTVQVRSRQFVVKTNVLGYTYNVLLKKTTNIEFGNFRKDVKTVFSNISANISDLKKRVVTENIAMNEKITEGAFTPIFYSVGASFTYAQNRGWYTKKGNEVTAHIYIQVSSKSGILTNSVFISQLPFISKGGDNLGCSAAIGVHQFTLEPSMWVGPGSDGLNVYRRGTNTTLKASNVANGYYLLTITYIAV